MNLSQDNKEAIPPDPEKMKRLLKEFRDLGGFKGLNSLKRKLAEYTTNLYFIKSNDLVKIGTAERVNKRLAELQIGNPVKLEVIKIISPVKPRFEKELHKKLREYHVRDEWFRIEVMEVINEFIGG